MVTDGLDVELGLRLIQGCVTDREPEHRQIVGQRRRDVSEETQCLAGRGQRVHAPPPMGFQPRCADGDRRREQLRALVGTSLT